MKTFIAVLLSTITFVIFGFFMQHKIIEFTDKYEKKISIIENEIQNDNLETAQKLVNSFIDSWQKDINFWYYLLNHEFFDEITSSIQIIEKSIETQDKIVSMIYIELIKVNLQNILQYEKLDLDHTF